MFFTVLSALFTVVVSTILFKNAAGSLSLGKINIISYVYYLSVLQLLAGAVLVSLGYDKHYTLQFLLFRNDSLMLGTYATYYMMIALPFFMLLFLKLMKISPNEDYEAFLNRDYVEESDSFIYVLLLFVSVIQVVLLSILIMRIGYIPLMKFIHADPSIDYLLEGPRISGITILGTTLVRNIVLYLGIPLVSYICFAYVLVSKKLKWIVLFAVMFILSIVVITIDFSKSPLIFHLFTFLLIWMYHCKGIKSIFIVPFGIMMAALLMAFYKIVGYQGSFLDIYNGILGRTIFTQFGTLCYHFDLFPSVIGFLGGRSLPGKLLPLLGMDPSDSIRSGRIVMDFYGSEHVYEGTAGVMNANFMGEAYANWGMMGVLFGIVWVAFVIAVLFMMCLKIKKSPVTIALLAVLTKMIGSVTQGGFVDFIYSATLIITIVGCLFLIYFNDIIDILRKAGERRG